MTIVTRKNRSFKYQKKQRQSNSVLNTERCPGCLSYPNNIRALALYVHKTTGRTFGYTLCNSCVARLQLNPRQIIANVENYFSDEIAKMDMVSR